MDESLNTLDDQEYYIKFMTCPDRSYCDGRFLSLAAELVRMGHKPRVVAQAALNVGIEQAEADGVDYYDGFMRGLGSLSEQAAAWLAEDTEEAEKQKGV